jgi:hypothetical protein
MTLKISIVLTALALSCLPQLATAQGNLVVNGGFDTDASGWIITNIDSGSGYRSLAGNPPGCVLLYNLSHQNNPTASQEINGLTPGALYIVSGDYQGGGKDTVDNSFVVALDGVYLFETSAPENYLNWYSFSFDYNATSTSALLSLSTLIGTGDGYYIDNIAMYAVPEPSSFWLISISGIVSATFLSNHRNGLNHI